MSDFLEEFKAQFVERCDPEDFDWEYFGSEFKADLIFRGQTHLEEHRWYDRVMDVFERESDGALAGIAWDKPATEEQEGQERNAEVVRVEAYTTTAYREA